MERLLQKDGHFEILKKGNDKIEIGIDFPDLTLVKQGHWLLKGVGRDSKVPVAIYQKIDQGWARKLLVIKDWPIKTAAELNTDPKSGNENGHAGKETLKNEALSIENPKSTTNREMILDSNSELNNESNTKSNPTIEDIK